MTNIWFWVVVAFLVIDYIIYVVILRRSEQVRALPEMTKLMLYAGPFLAAVVIIGALYISGVFA